MTVSDPSGPIVPSLLVRDMTDSLAFYTGVLGFEQTGATPGQEPPNWAEVRRGDAVFWLYTDPPVGTPTEPVMSGTIYIFADGVEALAREVREKVELAWGPEVMEYGMREFAVKDPDGYLLAFTEPA